MTTYNEKVWKENCLDAIERDSKYLPLLRSTAHRLNHGFFDSGQHAWSKIIAQKWNSEYDIFDAHCFIYLWARIQNKQIACIPAGPIGLPGADADKEHNNFCLRQLPTPFCGRFSGGVGEQDGFVRWELPIETGLHSPPMLPSGLVPLEVGYTEAWTTIRHCFCHCGVARWPYNSELLYLLLPVESLEGKLPPVLSKIFSNSGTDG